MRACLGRTGDAVALGGLVLALAAPARAVATGPVAVPAPAAPTPSTTIVLMPARASLRLGIDREVDVALDLSGPEAARFVPLRALATVGTLDPPQPGAPGHFVLRYHPPADRFPQVALLLVEVGDGDARLHCATRIVLEGSTLFPFQTEAYAAVTMQVGGRQFGPAIADHLGHVVVPIEVPPGVRKAEARAVDRSGASREAEVDLHLPPFPRVLLLAPTSVEAGSFSAITEIALDENGAPAGPERLTLTASSGVVHRLGGSPGEARFLFEAPAHLGPGQVTLSATAPGAPVTQTAVTIPLRAGPARRLTIDATSTRLIVGEPTPVTVSITARDRFDNLVSVNGASVRLDGKPTPVTVTPQGTATLALLPPARYDGHDAVVIDATLGAVTATRRLLTTGGPPVRLTLQLGAPRVIANGHRAVALRVRAVDAKGTPTAVPGLSWHTPDGHIRDVRVPRDGEYLADYIPDRTREVKRQTLSVMASPTLRAEATLEVTPPPVRLVAGAQTGLFTNFGSTVGPAFFIDGLVPLRLRWLRLLAGFSAGYLRGDVTSAGVTRAGTARLETNQFPLLAVLRTGLPLPRGFTVTAEADAGWSLGWVRVTANPGRATQIDAAAVNAPALGGGGEIDYPLHPGWIAVGVRYLWIDLGRTSSGDRIAGNSAGLIAELGYRMTF